MKSLFRLEDLEFSQAQLRLVVAFVVSLYALIMYPLGLLDANLLKAVLVTGALFTLLSVLLLAHLWFLPQPMVWRRVAGMLLDNLGACAVMILGQETLLPTFCVLLSMTVGNGVRFGRPYLILATTFGLASLALIAVFVPFLQEHPAVLVMMVLSMLVLPTFSYFLLGRLQQAMAAAKRADQDKSRFLAQASHDLRQPIHAIGLFTTCLRGTPLNAEQHQLIDSVDRSLLSVEQLFRSLLDIYTLDQQQVMPHKQTVNLQRLLVDLQKQNSEAARWAGVEIRLRGAATLTYSDPALLSTLLQNLISNAIKYAPGSPLLIACRRRGSTLTVQLHDRGPGIAAEHLPHLFEEFYRVRQARDRDVEGIGLGLSIVKRIATLLDLRISVASRVGHGTSITLAGLPAVTAHRVANARPPAEPVADLQGIHVLLIEDDRSVLEAMAKLLRAWGCQVTALDGPPSEALPCDVVVTDFDLGREATGIECLAQLEKWHGRALPAVILTGHDPERIMAALPDPRIPLLSKPVRSAELQRVIAELAGRQVSAPLP
ncbi:hybrid sensor histidine kinase/response regulator [Pseudomonas argentinensis]|uniref:histidine kinase n=1 Tax=Phytopseudomonas argentinensis TaxID=289370 RepID=A0A1I3KAH6_9GAMM|nr:hybrid sensor histidine kinase/response regulator [Pseudomonas argentinensis]KAB0550708.1 hybrid sensor histidine kinase/response regulator [Pseudomonas argentinensis]SFI69516.1 hypothetical protein SAMN05216602_2383 [Pseudomonas argentinensis]